jgi:hypothetical protein
MSLAVEFGKRHNVLSFDLSQQRISDLRSPATVIRAS